MKRVSSIMAVFAFLACVSGCNRVAFVPDVEDETEPVASYAEQPRIPMYEQLMLKGRVKIVEDFRIPLQQHEHSEIERYGFDEKGLLTYYYDMGMELGCDKDTKCSMFPLIDDAYACWLFPDSWEESRSGELEHVENLLDDAGEVIGRKEKRIEYEWDERGRFTDVRGYLDGERVPLPGGAEDAGEYLYDENGYPHNVFAFDGDLPRDAYHLEFSDFDEHGNPLTIYILFVSTGYDAVIYRNIEYYE